MKQFCGTCLGILGMVYLLIAPAAQADGKARPDTPASTSVAGNRPLPTLYIVGDSTLRSDAPLRGWGQEIGAFFDPAKITVVNRAIGGRSSRTFLTEGRWDKITAVLKPGDFVMIQFGHNDNGDYKNPAAKGRPSIRSEGEETAQAVTSDGKTMELIHTFGWYMRKYGDDTKAKGAVAIFCSMVPHKDWKDGRILRPEQTTFVKWTADAAQASSALFIDLNAISARSMEELGPDKVEALFGDKRTHSTPAGAKFNAMCVIAGLKALHPDPLTLYFSPAADAVPPTTP